MQLKPLTPNQSLNKAYRKEKVGRVDGPTSSRLAEIVRLINKNSGSSFPTALFDELDSLSSGFTSLRVKK